MYDEAAARNFGFTPSVAIIFGVKNSYAIVKPTPQTRAIVSTVNAKAHKMRRNKEAE
jgi:hypothetical protein